MSNIVIKKISRDNCVPCKILSNYLTEIDLDEHGAELVELNISEDDTLADKYNLNSVPVLIYERNGVEISRSVGLVPVQEIEESIVNAKEAK